MFMVIRVLSKKIIREKKYWSKSMGSKEQIEPSFIAMYGMESIAAKLQVSLALCGLHLKGVRQWNSLKRHFVITINFSRNVYVISLLFILKHHLFYSKS